jgi:hypothetical protein
MFTLRVNDSHYPMVSAPVDWHDGGWRTSILPRVTPEVSEEIDHNHCPEYRGFLVDTIYFAMIDGWSSAGTIFKDDEELEPVHWAIEYKGSPIGRNALELLLNP